jgi:hypothetical protein
MCYPPHSSLIRTFGQNLKQFKASENFSSWIRRNPGYRIRQYDVADIVSDAFIKVCRLEVASYLAQGYTD